MWLENYIDFGCLFLVLHFFIVLQYHSMNQKISESWGIDYLLFLFFIFFILFGDLFLFWLLSKSVLYICFFVIEVTDCIVVLLLTELFISSFDILDSMETVVFLFDVFLDLKTTLLVLLILFFVLLKIEGFLLSRRSLYRRSHRWKLYTDQFIESDWNWWWFI